MENGRFLTIFNVFNFVGSFYMYYIWNKFSIDLCFLVRKLQYLMAFCFRLEVKRLLNR